MSGAEIYQMKPERVPRRGAPKYCECSVMHNMYIVWRCAYCSSLVLQVLRYVQISGPALRGALQGFVALPGKMVHKKKAVASGFLAQSMQVDYTLSLRSSTRSLSTGSCLHSEPELKFLHNASTHLYSAVQHQAIPPADLQAAAQSAAIQAVAPGQKSGRCQALDRPTWTELCSARRARISATAWGVCAAPVGPAPPGSAFANRAGLSTAPARQRQHRTIQTSATAWGKLLHHDQAPLLLGRHNPPLAGKALEQSAPAMQLSYLCTPTLAGTNKALEQFAPAMQLSGLCTPPLPTFTTGCLDGIQQPLQALLGVVPLLLCAGDFLLQHVHL